MKFGLRKKNKVFNLGGGGILGNMKFGLREKNKVFNFMGGYSGEHEIWT